MNDNLIPHEESAKYLGMHLNAKANWITHIDKKISELRLRYLELYWILNRKSRTAIHNKVLVYNQILKPIWMYGTQLWGCASNSQIKRIQTFQNKVLSDIVNAHRYISAKSIHRDLNIPMVKDVIKMIATKHEN